MTNQKQLISAYNLGVKLTYGIIFEDFRSLFPPQTSIRKPRPALYFAIVMGGLLALAGVLVVLKAMRVLTAFGIPEGSIGQGAGTVAFGAAVIVFCVFYERQLDQKLRGRYESALRTKFKALDCPENRTLEITSEGIQTVCNCGSISRPWSEVSAFAEGPLFFQITTRQQTYFVPKRAFASESEQTEFRALFDGYVDVAPVISGTRIQFSYGKADSRRARMLHLRKGVSLKKKAELALTCAAMIGAFAYGFRFMSERPNVAIGLGVCLLLIAFRVLPLVRKSKTRYRGPFVASFGADGIQLQDATGTAMYRWDDFSGYTKDSFYWLLYYKNNKYRIFPKRAFRLNQASEFDRLVVTHLQPITSLVH